MKLLFFLCCFGCIAWESSRAQVHFEAQTLDDSVAIGYGLAIGEMDGDGRPDILLADKKAFVWYRNGDWKRVEIIRDLTARDNVCIAARDLDGDGLVEIAVGAQWNPGETTDAARSGSVHYLLRPTTAGQPWRAVGLHHEPTVHRMLWVRTGNSYQLLVLPLHGRGNRKGEGAGVRLLAYPFPARPHEASNWTYLLADSSMHLTHNFEVIEAPSTSTKLLIAGKEGIRELEYVAGAWQASGRWVGAGSGFGEVRRGQGPQGPFVCGIHPMHGNELRVYGPDDRVELLADDLNQGHALACGDLLGLGYEQIVVGWRAPNEAGKVGIRLYVPPSSAGETWQMHLIDDNNMACEDLKIADLDGDGKAEII
ncbi:MAG: VCBS repeat-containing protein, partial [Bacteroidetes bacterium]